jgi:hypothetical protein
MKSETADKPPATLSIAHRPRFVGHKPLGSRYAVREVEPHAIQTRPSATVGFCH